MSSSVASASSSRPTFFGLFDRTAAPEQDIEAQTAIAEPSPALTHPPRAQRASVDSPTTDAVDAFFGVSPTARAPSPALAAGTRDSRHDGRPLSASVQSDVLPPSYEDSLAPPSYTQVSDQPTLAMYLFKFGFLFPLFWVAGALILLSPLSAPEDWEAAKPEFERQELIESMRRTELKWARRCLAALFILVLVVAAVALSVIFIMHSA